MIAYETRLGKIDISEAYLSKLIGHEVTSCFGVVGMVASGSKQKILGKIQKNEPIDTGIKVYGDDEDITSEYYIASRSPYKFIKSGYKDTHQTSYTDYPDYYLDYTSGKTGGILFQIGEGLHPVYGPLSDMAEEDMKLLGFGYRSDSRFEIFTLYPVNKEKKISAKTLKVELTDTEGNVLTASVENN